jgi:protein-tyrosine-phosphatase
MAEHNLDLSLHKAKPITENLVDYFHLILTMEEIHKKILQQLNPPHSSRIFMLSEMAGRCSEIKDPRGLSLDHYRKTAKVIYQLFERGKQKIFQLAMAE